ncbi:MAG: DNA-3-methyladenine glycosylase family protein [Dehalococcoidia bacterium]
MPHRKAAVAHLTPRAPFAFDLALDYLRGSPSAVIERIEGGGYLRPVTLHGRLFVLRVSSVGDTDQPCLRVELAGQDLSQEDARAAVDLTRRIFTTDHDLAELSAIAEADPVFGRLVRRFRGLRPVVIADPFEAIVWAILGQQINITFAAKLKRALVDRFGTTIERDGLTLSVFPPPERLAALEHERDLLPLQFSRQKSRYTIALARAVCEGRIDLVHAGTLPPEEAIAALMAFPGIGRWTAEYALMRAFGHPDVMPAGDGGLKQIIGREYGLGRQATETEIRTLGERWRGWRGYAAFYWWFQLQQETRARRTAKAGAVAPAPTGIGGGPVESATGQTRRRR